MTVFTTLMLGIFFLANALIGAAVLSWLDNDARYNHQLFVWYQSAPKYLGFVVGWFAQLLVLQLWFIVAAICFYDMSKHPKESDHGE